MSHRCHSFRRAPTLLCSPRGSLAKRMHFCCESLCSMSSSRCSNRVLHECMCAYEVHVCPRIPWYCDRYPPPCRPWTLQTPGCCCGLGRSGLKGLQGQCWERRLRRPPRSWRFRGPQKGERRSCCMNWGQTYQPQSGEAALISSCLKEAWCWVGYKLKYTLLSNIKPKLFLSRSPKSIAFVFMLPFLTLRSRWGWLIPAESACAMEASAAELRKMICKFWLLALHCMHCAVAATSLHTHWLPPKPTSVDWPAPKMAQHSAKIVPGCCTWLATQKLL